MDLGLRFGRRPCLDVVILDDEVVEEIETFTVTLSTSHPDIQILDNNQTIITIFDTDAEVSVPVELSVAEDEGTVQVCATLNTYTSVDTTVTLATSDGTGMCVQQLALPCVI